MIGQQDFLIDIFELSSNDLAYFAGLFDGEGSISIRKGSKPGIFVFGLSIAMVSPIAINDWHSAFGGKVIPQPNPKGRSLYRWYAYGSRAELILWTLLPYLRVKKSEAELAIKYRRYKSRLGFVDIRNKMVEDILEIRHSKEDGIEVLRNKFTSFRNSS